MPKPGLVAILYVLDRSGSMGVVWGDTVGAYDRFLEEQKALPGEAEFGLTDFDTVITRHPITPLARAVPLSQQAEVIFPRGATALIDAVGRTVQEVGAEFTGRPEDQRPERVLLVIQTDGHENSSREYTGEQVRELIQHQKDHYGWEVIFLGADQDAWDAGVMFAASSSLSYSNVNQAAAYNYTSEQATSLRSTGRLREKGAKDIRPKK